MRLLVHYGEPTLSRQQFVDCFASHFGSGSSVPTVPEVRRAFARDLLATLCRRYGLTVHARTLYPMQPRPFDLTPRDLHRLTECMVTPKVNGSEAFCLLHAFGTAVVQRSGEVHWFPPGPRHIWPVLLEGELLNRHDPAQQPLVLVVYDCVLTPTLCYVHHGRHGTRAAALQAVLHVWIPPPGLRVLRKPCHHLALHPHQSIALCQQWSRRTGIPCDGVVLADASVVGYAVPDRLWKLKDSPTIDYTLCAVPGHHRLFELMLRGGDGVMLSLHAFRHVGDDEHTEPYRLPVLLQGDGLRSGQTVELALRMQGREGTFVTMQVRESAKQPNFLWGGLGAASHPAPEAAPSVRHGHRARGVRRGGADATHQPHPAPGVHHRTPASDQERLRARVPHPTLGAGRRDGGGHCGGRHPPSPPHRAGPGWRTGGGLPPLGPDARDLAHRRGGCGQQRPGGVRASPGLDLPGTTGHRGRMDVSPGRPSHVPAPGRCAVPSAGSRGGSRVLSDGGSGLSLSV